MEISIISQLISIFYAFIFGVVSCPIYFLNKSVRRIFCPNYSDKFANRMKNKEYKRINNPIKIAKKQSRVYNIAVTAAFDLLFFIFLAIEFPVFFYITTDGVIRWYVFAFFTIGFFVYKITLGKISDKIFEFLQYYFQIAALNLFYILKKPLLKTKNKLKSLMITIKGKIKDKMQKKTKKESKNVLISFGKNSKD